VPGVFINGPSRDRLGIPYGPGCFGGEAGPAPAIGRAIRLVMRNVGGQVVGQSSKSVFGQPARVTGLVVAEWEERSPWAPLAERRGVEGDAVTVKDVTGTIDVADISAVSGAELLEIIGKSLAFPGTNAFIDRDALDAEILVAIAPPWAERIAADFPDVEAVQETLQRHASLPLDWWPPTHRELLAGYGRADADGRVALVARPEQMMVMVCGGLANLHALAIHSFGPTKAVTRAF
jgi:hypothetical protein